MPGFRVNRCKGVHSVAHDINGLVSFFPTLPAIAINIIVNAYIFPFDLTFRTRKIKLQDLYFILSIIRLTYLYC